MSAPLARPVALSLLARKAWCHQPERPFLPLNRYLPGDSK
jgi:hypothetical protein